MKYLVEQGKRPFALSIFRALAPWPVLCVVHKAFLVINSFSCTSCSCAAGMDEGEEVHL